MQTLNMLIREYNWTLLSWSERYGNGVWVVAGPIINHLYELQEIKEGNDLESLELGHYLGNEGVWLPVVHAADVSIALEILEERIIKVANDAEWRDAVYKAFDSILEENDGSYGLKNAVQQKKKELMKPENQTDIL